MRIGKEATGKTAVSGSGSKGGSDGTGTNPRERGRAEKRLLG